MPERASILSTATPARVNLKPYSAELPLGTLAVGVDNIHHDVFLSPAFVDSTETYLLEFIRQTATSLFWLKRTACRRTGANWDGERPIKKWLGRLNRHPGRTALRSSPRGAQRAKLEKNIEMDLLLRVALLKYLTQEISTQFSNLLLEAKEWIRGRGTHFDQTEQAHVIKARARGIAGGSPQLVPDTSDSMCIRRLRN